MTVIGIDLGTTNTVVGAVQDGQALTLHDEAGRALIPSVVSFHPNGSVLVGHPARERRLVDARNTVYSVKRLIGRSFGSEEVTRARQRFPFEMREGPGQAALIVARGETFTLPEISAFVLRHAKGLAEAALGQRVERAVITVPANFNDLQRAATKVAGRVAGLEVLRILNEPTAAALAYGYGRQSDERIAIYDFGGGTFDLTLLDLSGNVFEVLATAGNTFLGGDDIDIAIAERMADACLRQHRFDPRTDANAFERLRVAAEHLKVALSRPDAAKEQTEDIPELAHGPGGKPLGLSFTLTATELDAIAAPFVERTFEVCAEALGIARLRPGDFAQVVLVGGSTRLAAVRRRVAEFFGRAPLDRVSADEVVALGAAIQANALTTAQRRSVIPRPPLPAARTSAPPPAAPRKTQPPPFPRKTDPFGGRRASRPAAAEVAGPPERPRQITGIGLGPAAPPLPEVKQTLSGPGTPAAAFEPPTVPDPASPPPSAAPVPIAGEEDAIPTRPENDIPLATEAPALRSPSARAPVDPGPPAGDLLPAAAAGSLAAAMPMLPLLVDVTPLSLSVETVSDYCDVVIQRNTPVPCAQSRVFVTSMDNQTVVTVRVGQGESGRFSDNTVLGQLELSGLPPAPRGRTQIVVTFSLDSDGLLQVTAAEPTTGVERAARLRLVGLPDEADVAALVHRHARRRIHAP